MKPNINRYFFSISVNILVIILCSSLHLRAQIDDSYLKPPQIIKYSDFGSDHLVQNRTASGIPSLAVTRDGRIWVTWYSGVTPGIKVEHCRGNYVIIAVSDNNGRTWQEVAVIDPDGMGPVRAFDPQLWIDPKGKLWVFWSQEIRNQRKITSETGKPHGVWAMTIKNPEYIADVEFTTPERIADGIMMNKPIILSTGEWALPVSTWRHTDYSARLVVSTDKGKTWNVRGALNILPRNIQTADEHMVVERKDGSLWMLVRTRYGIGESISKDRGYNWSPLQHSPIKHPSARFFIYRLHSGSLLLVKHGPIEMQTRRSHLMAFISKDDGISWSEGLLLDAGRTYSNDITPNEQRNISYPDGQQVEGGTIYLTYDYGRQEEQLILLISFTEEDILSGSLKNMVRVHQERRIVSKGGL